MQWLDPVEIPDEGEANRALDNAYLDPEAFMVTLDNYFEIRGSGIMTRRAASTTCYVGECEFNQANWAESTRPITISRLERRQHLISGHVYAISPTLPVHQVGDEIFAKRRMSSPHDFPSFVGTDVSSATYKDYRGVNMLVGAYYGFKTSGVPRTLLKGIQLHPDQCRQAIYGRYAT